MQMPSTAFVSFQILGGACVTAVHDKERRGEEGYLRSGEARSTAERWK